MHKIFFLLGAACLLAAQNAQAQNEPFLIYGKLISENNNTPISGITIKLRHTQKATTSHPDGSFSLFLQAEADTLDILNMGYLQRSLPVSRQMMVPITILLKPITKDLDEVILNTGYQKIPKERSTGSFTSISKSLFNQQSGTGVLERLESISNGLYFDRQTGTGVNIVIRGLSTIQGPRAPLIILDDFPYEGDLNNLNPNDVENITILKDAAAASIWGTRAGNGVIVITSKKGKYEQPIKVEFSSNMTITGKPDLSYAKEISSPDFISVERFLFTNGFYNAQLSGQPWLGISPVVEILNQQELGNISQSEAESQIKDISTHSLQDDFKKYVYQSSRNFQQAITVRGGSKNIAWNLGGGWDHNADPLHATYNRINFRSNQSFKLHSKWEISTGIDYTQSTMEAGQLGYGQLRPKLGNLPVYTKLADEHGMAWPVLYEYREKYTDTAGGGKLMDWNWYPLTDDDHIRSSHKIQAILVNIGSVYHFLPAFTLQLKYQYGRQSGNTQSIYDKESYFARNLINGFTSIDPATGKTAYGVPVGGIRNDWNMLLETQNIRGQLNYSKKWNSHEINAIFGSEYRQIEIDDAAYRSYGYDPDILLSRAVNYTIPYPNYLTGISAYVPDGTGYSGTINRYISFFGNAAYSFKNKYTLSWSGRRDASNLFGATSNNRWTPLWSAGIGWDINKEEFYKCTKLPLLKLRASYGTSGNADPLRSAVTTLQFSSVSKYTQLPIARITQFKNTGLSWERVGMLNLGLDFATRGNRLSGSVEYYYKKGTNLFGTAQVDYTGLAFNSIIKNVASIAGHGFEMGIQSNNIIGAFTWSTQLNLNFNKDKVLTYYLTDLTASNFTVGGSISALEGKPVYALYDFKWAGLDPGTGDPRGYLNGNVSKDYDSLSGAGALVTDLKYIGPTLPTTVFSLGNTFSWQNLSLTLRITGKFGNYFQRPSINYSSLFTNRIGHADFSLRWQLPGDENHTQVPSMIYPLNPQREIFYAGSEVLATKADLIRLQYITLAYQFKKPALQFYININNLGLIWKANQYGIDPEYINSQPPTTNYAFGLKATF